MTVAVPVRRPASWQQVVLRGLEWVANPALAGLAFCLLSLGVVTWLPALAATAHALRRWRSDGEQQCFVEVFRSFRGAWRVLWRHSVVSTVVLVVLLVNVLFLAGQASMVGLVLFAVHLGIAAVLVPYHLALAAVFGREPSLTGSVARQQAVILGFAGWHGPLLLVTSALAVLVSLPLAVGPFLFGPSMSLLVALRLAERRS